MGCIIEFFLEFVFETLFEGYIALMSLILPKHNVSKWGQILLKIILFVFAVLLLFALIIGIVMMFEEDVAVKNSGRKLTTVLLIIMAIQIGLGIIMRVITRKR